LKNASQPDGEKSGYYLEGVDLKEFVEKLLRSHCPDAIALCLWRGWRLSGMEWYGVEWGGIEVKADQGKGRWWRWGWWVETNVE
jgi:hypothetical protein